MAMALPKHHDKIWPHLTIAIGPIRQHRHNTFARSGFPDSAIFRHLRYATMDPPPHPTQTECDKPPRTIHNSEIPIPYRSFYSFALISRTLKFIIIRYIGTIITNIQNTSTSPYPYTNINTAPEHIKADPGKFRHRDCHPQLINKFFSEKNEKNGHSIQ